jgi:transporter family protein
MVLKAFYRTYFSMMGKNRFVIFQKNRKRSGSKMGMVFFLAVFGMVCWGIAPIFAKIGLKNVDPSAGLTIRTIFAACVVTSWALMSCNVAQLRGIPLNSWLLIAVEAILATLVGDLAYYAAIKKGDVSLVTIIMSSSPLVTILCAVIFLGEQITLLRLAGAILVVLGIILII